MLSEPTRRSLVWETRFIMLAFIYPSAITAVILFIRSRLDVAGTGQLSGVTPGHPLANLLLGIPDYLAIAVIVPIALLLLQRSGQPPSTLGLALPGWRSDIWPGFGLALASLGSSMALAVVIGPFLNRHHNLTNQVSIGSVPHYYVIYGLVVAATTAITEEVIVNGYLLVRLEQLGWTPQRALLLSLALRTSYHLYYGAAVLFTIPFGYFMTRSFQKHRRLTRPIVTHFMWDSILFTLAILTS